MEPLLHVNIKGKNFWKVCALLVMSIVITCCYVFVTELDQPTTAKAGDLIPITLHDSTFFSISIGPSGGPYIQFENANWVFAILVPKGWADAAQKAKVTYTSTLGNGTMVPMPSTIVEPSNGKGLNYSDAAMAKFGIQKNLVNDVVWVVFESPTQYVLNNQAKVTGTISIQLPAGPDGYNTSFVPSYISAETYDGYTDYMPGTPDYNITNGQCLVQTGGSNGILRDYCNAQLTSVDPPKTKDNEFVTLTYNNKLDTNVTPLTSKTNLFLCVDSAYTSDGKVLTNFCIQSAKSHLVQTTPTSGLFKITFWPRSYFGITSPTVSVTKLVYHITDDTGNNKIGYGGNPNIPFIYVFGCN